MSSPSLLSPAVWHFAIPQLVVSAGSGGAMLTITLLHATELVLEPGRVLVLHDPVGLTGERVLAHVYREAALRTANADADVLPSGARVQWLVVRPPLTRVWDAMDTLDDRAWRAVQRRAQRSGRSTTHTFPPATQPSESRSPRVAETLRSVPDAHARRARGHALLLLSESDRPDAISTLATARLLTRALRRSWAVLATVREGPCPSAHRPAPAERPWCDRVVCQGGVLRPVAAR